MSLVSLLLFVPVCFSLNLTPGPNNLMALNNAKNHGLQAAVLAGCGRLLAFVFLISLAASGLAVVLYSSAAFFNVIKIAGACYILYLACKLWTSDDTGPVSLRNEGSPRLYRLARREFLVAAGNPKAILIFTAFLPQFVDQQGDYVAQFFVLGAVFLVLELIAITCYGLIGLYLQTWFARPSSQQRFNRASAAVLACAGVGLLLSER